MGESYKDRVAKLIEQRKMTKAGLAAIETSKQNGLWDYWADVDALIVPKDLDEALLKPAIAKTNFDNSAPYYGRNLLRWVKLAKTDTTREERIKQIVEFATRNEKIPQM